ncbi:oligosaccharide flippase family protein [Deefgea sp. CFH1-16]|uniref:oligosaccharide flippase family protein n=1 Tax=Deefgea sp. CFH1-16 TaxID=2675457 RepID=UPI0015F7714D|nr:oligosaccharide flippase family protein [Deefgea sp. CFH1-16]
MIKNTTQRVKSSMLSLLVGRPISALAGMLVLVLLSRLLPSEQYAVYFTIWAVVEILIIVSNFGLMLAVYRYVSASIVDGGKIIIHGPVFQLILLRTISLLLVGFLLTKVSSVLDGYIHFDVVPRGFIFFLAVINFF